MMEEEMLMTVPEMRDVMEKCGYTCAQMERFTAVPAATIRRLLSGQTKKCKRETMLALSAVLRPLAEEGNSPAGGFKRLTIEDYRVRADERRSELIDGVYYELALPSMRHQFVSGEIYAALNLQLKQQKSRSHVFYSPAEVLLRNDLTTVVQPDIFICPENRNNPGGHFITTPELVIEIVSPSTRRKDILTKSRKYSQAGVREYWIVDLEQERVIVQGFERKKDHIYDLWDVVPVQISDGRIQVDFAAIMRGMRHFFGSCNEPAGKRIDTDDGR